jgi:hypothetical protein
VKPPKISIYTHLAVLQKLVYRLPTIENLVTKARLESVISTYQRLYA